MGLDAPEPSLQPNRGEAADPTVPVVLPRTPHRARLIVAGTLVLLLGLSTTVAVSWLAAVAHFELVQMPQAIALLDRGFDIDALNAGWHYSENIQIAITSRSGSPDSSSGRSPTLTKALQDRAGGLPTWSRFASPPDHLDETVWELDCGWPAPALNGHLKQHDRELFSEEWRAIGGIHLDPRWGGAYTTWFLPFGPVWPGLLLSWFFWSMLWLLIALLPSGRSAMNRAYWRWRKWCPWCQYDMRAARSDTCSECGRSKHERSPLFRRRWLAFLGVILVALVGAESAAVIHALRSHHPLLLHYWAGAGDVDAVNELIRHGADVNGFQPFGCWLASQTTPLMAAAHAGRTDAIRALLEAGADVRLAEPRAQIDALLLAVAAGNTEAARTLIESGARGQSDRLGGPLLWAAYYDHLDTVEMLLQAGFDVDDAAGQPPLSAAASQGNMDVIHLLLSAGAKVNARDRSGETPLMSAVEGGQLDVVDLLIGCGADTSARNAAGRSVLSHAPGRENSADIIKRLVAAGADVNARGAKGYTALMQAVEFDDVSAVEALLDLGADPSLVDDDGQRADQLGFGEAPEAILRFKQRRK